MVMGTDLHLERGIAFKIEGNYDAAMAELSKALTASPQNAEVYHQIGLVQGFTGDFDESLENLKRAVELDGSSVTTRYDLAMTYAMLGYYDEAKREFEEVLRREPGHDNAKKQLAFLA